MNVKNYLKTMRKCLVMTLGVAATVTLLAGCEADKKAESVEANTTVASNEANDTAKSVEADQSTEEDFQNYEEAFQKLVEDVEDITIPEGVRIVALGEATHGNNEFQELKLQVFKHLVETTDVRAFVLEGDFGGCALINDYIQGGEGDIDEITCLLGYRIYRTDNMRNLIAWMREYNETAAEDDKVRIYGMDIQYDTRCIKILNDFYAKVDSDKYDKYNKLIIEKFGEEEDAYNPKEYDELISFLQEMNDDLTTNKDEYVEKSSDVEYQYAVKAVDNFVYYLQYREKERFGSKYRDTCMKENVDWILKLEEETYGKKIMIAGHNGHLTKNQSTTATFLGKFLYDEYGDAYFAIGTDFYITECNINNNGVREIHEFCSDDMLAYQVGQMEKNMYYLDFAKANESKILSEVINSPMPTGSLGEAYSEMMTIMKNTYQINIAPAEMFDGMIFVYKATPIEVWEK